MAASMASLAGAMMWSCTKTAAGSQIPAELRSPEAGRADGGGLMVKMHEAYYPAQPACTPKSGGM